MTLTPRSSGSRPPLDPSAFTGFSPDEEPEGAVLRVLTQAVVEVETAAREEEIEPEEVFDMVERRRLLLETALAAERMRSPIVIDPENFRPEALVEPESPRVSKILALLDRLDTLRRDLEPLAALRRFFARPSDESPTG